MGADTSWIARSYDSGGRWSEALYSPCERYRYALTRLWEPDAPRLSYVMLNPSKATERQNDPTIERCERRARALGYGGFRAVNLFAWRETDPARLRQAPAPVGPLNDRALIEAAQWADVVLCAWGVHGVHNDRAAKVLPLLRSAGTTLKTLGLTKAGHPRHPLYVSYATRPVDFN